MSALSLFETLLHLMFFVFLDPIAGEILMVCQRGEGIHGDCRCSPTAGGTIHPKCRGVGIMKTINKIKISN